MCVLKRGGLNFPPLFLFREGVSNIYNMRKLKYNWTDEELIEWCKTKTMRSELKRENNTKFKRVIQRGLEDYLPKYEGRWALRTMDPEAKAEIMKDKNSVVRRPYKRRSQYPVDEQTPGRMYRTGGPVEGGVMCGRCLEIRSYTTNKLSKLCKVCYNRTCTLIQQEKDINLWNVRDQFCNSKITHYEKVFEIGVKVDEKTQNYLTMIGYGFIFKEIYDETSYHMKQQ
jgi:hypothetical protein